MRILFLTSMVCLLCMSCASAKREDFTDFQEAPLLGMIYDAQNSPVSGVSIAIDGTATAESDIEGRFLIPRLSRGAILFGPRRMASNRSISSWHS